jgi:hypothetical protein
MPRIGGPGGPNIPPQTQGPAAAETPKADFASKVAQAATTASAQGTDAARSQQAKSTQQQALIGKTRDIASRFAKGQLSQKEATREFVSLVIEDKFPQFKRKKKKKGDQEGDEEEGKESAEEKLEEAVTELIDRDPVLAKKLQTQFKKLAAKG